MKDDKNPIGRLALRDSLDDLYSAASVLRETLSQEVVDPDEVLMRTERM
jgi:hypothetical protein